MKNYQLKARDGFTCEVSRADTMWAGIVVQTALDEIDTQRAAVEESLSTIKGLQTEIDALREDLHRERETCRQLRAGFAQQTQSHVDLTVAYKTQTEQAAIVIQQREQLANARNLIEAQETQAAALRAHSSAVTNDRDRLLGELQKEREQQRNPITLEARPGITVTARDIHEALHILGAFTK